MITVLQHCTSNNAVTTGAIFSCVHEVASHFLYGQWSMLTIEDSDWSISGQKPTVGTAIKFNFLARTNENYLWRELFF